jgi:hypothetical protein
MEYFPVLANVEGGFLAEIILAGSHSGSARFESRPSLAISSLDVSVKQGQEFFLFLTSRPTLGPSLSLSPIQCVPVFSSGVKQPEREVDYASASSVEVKNRWSYTFTPVICLHSVGRGNFTFGNFIKLSITTLLDLYLYLLKPSGNFTYHQV